MANMAPLGVLFAIVIVGITLEAVEQQSKRAAYALLILILLGIITFNSGAFTQQLGGIVSALSVRRTRGVSRRVRPKSQPGQGR